MEPRQSAYTEAALAAVTTGTRRGRDRSWTVPFQRPSLPPLAAIDAYFALARAEGWYSNSGPCHDLLVERTGALLGGRPVVPVASAGIGLIVALRALVPGSAGGARQVVLPSFTFAATAAAVVWCGLEPVFCDIEAEGWHLCPERLEDLLARRPGRVAAVIACAAFGTPPDDDVASAWASAAQDRGIPLIVDAAAGFGAQDAGWPRPDAEVFSMHATKPLAVGEGGLVAFRDETAADAARILINHGLDADHEAVAVGLNGKLDEWRAATALAGLDRLDDALAARRAAAATMQRNLEGAGLRFQALSERSPSQFVPALAASGEQRAEILATAASRGVEMRTYYAPPLHASPAYGGCDRDGALPVTGDVSERILSLPMADDFSDAEQEQVAECFWS
jgi:dTDP-4-amino-4,6-dideoxygalactose transaminase